jgi:hypothetical protein
LTRAQRLKAQGLQALVLAIEHATTSNLHIPDPGLSLVTETAVDELADRGLDAAQTGAFLIGVTADKLDGAGRPKTRASSDDPAALPRKSVPEPRRPGADPPPTSDRGFTRAGDEGKALLDSQTKAAAQPDGLDGEPGL